MKKKGFTLIELLAVIVILAIIALIATPIILGIVEDSRKDSFMRSVELVIKTTDIDVINKLTKDGFEYTLIDGKIMVKEKSEQITAGYEIIDKDACVGFFENMGAPNEVAVSICNDEPHDFNDGMTLTEILSSGNIPQEAIDALKQAGAIDHKKSYTYTELNIAKNTDGMNGSIIYDKNGLEQYVIHNGKYCVMKIGEMKNAEIKDYVEEECAFPDERILAVLTYKVPNKNDIVTFTNGQLENLGEYGIRYRGSDPDNYVYFNCENYENQNENTCEIWRIIGVVDEKVKLVKEESIGQYAWDSQKTNNWSTASLNAYLNGEYYNSLSTATKKLISPSTWYLGGWYFDNGYNYTTIAMYELERTPEEVYGENPSSVNNTNVGLMYTSDYSFASNSGSDCQIGSYGVSSCDGWSKKTDEWLITPDATTSSTAFYTLERYSMSIYYTNYDELDVRPTIYLTEDIKIKEGEGTALSPYQLIPVE